MDGIEKAAVFLLGIGEENAAEILKYLSPREVQQLGLAMSKMEQVGCEQAETVMGDFLTEVETQTSLGLGAEDYVRSTMVTALGEEKAKSLMDRILLGNTTQGLEKLKWMDPKTIAEMIRYEHPQVIAIVLSYLDSEPAAAVLQLFSKVQQIDLVLRMSTIDKVHPTALQELNSLLEKQLAGMTGGQGSHVGGIKQAAEIMGFLDSSVEAEVLEGVTEVDESIGEQIQDLMFVFADLLDVDGRGIQAVLREVSSETLLLALKGADEPLKELFLTNMSKRAADLLVDDMEARGPVRVSEVETAQKEILSTVRKMSDAGEIVLGGKGGDEMV